jgi:hypothetical protein
VAGGAAGFAGAAGAQATNTIVKRIATEINANINLFILESYLPFI